MKHSFFSRCALPVWIAAGCAVFSHATAGTTTVDICIYGGTSGAVASAVQAKRMAKTVIIVSPDKHLGGMTSGGLGWTDIGDERILGGISKEFFGALYDHYTTDSAWDIQPRATYKNQGQGHPAMNHVAKTMSIFEPKVAERVFESWVKDNQIPVLRARLDRSKDGIVMDGKRILSMKTEAGDVIAAKMFIDATYEGDLMALAGVSYTIGREPNSKYGETISGVQTRKASGNQLPDGIDPYVVKGDKSSGLLPGVNPDAGGPDGTGDDRVQAYCYRMCLTNHEANRIMIGKPEGYDEKDYELLFRAIELGQKTRFFKDSPLPNFKTDSNNDSGISTDLIGASDAYPEADYATREKIAKRHELWQRGLVWTLQNHPRVPEPLRRQWGKWGLPKDEFLDTGHWAHALYVRVARRMVSDYVVSQKQILDSSTVTRSIGMGAYAMDSHNVQRHVSEKGFVRNEGDVQDHIKGPYRIDYGSIIPREEECENLLVTFCVSSSHMAFGSIRMEPVFMVLGHSATTAAALAIDQGVSVQKVPYAALEESLLKDGQRLSISAARPGPGDPAQVVDNEAGSDLETTGSWTKGSAHGDFFGDSYLHDDNKDKGGKSVKFHFKVDSREPRPVYLRWTSMENRASNVPVEIVHAKGIKKIKVDQKKDGGKWVELGKFSFDPAKGADVIVGNKGTDGVVIIDAAGLGPVGGAR